MHLHVYMYMYLDKQLENMYMYAAVLDSLSICYMCLYGNRGKLVIQVRDRYMYLYAHVLVYSI